MDTGLFSIVCLIELFCTLFRLFSSRCFLSLGFFNSGCFLSLCLFSSRCFFSLGLFNSRCFLNNRCIGSFLFSFLQCQNFSSCLVYLFLRVETSLCICTLLLFIFQLESVVGLLLVVLPGFETSFRFCLIECTLGDTTQEMLLHQYPFIGKDVAYGVRGLCPCLQPIQSSFEI